MARAVLLVDALPPRVVGGTPLVAYDYAVGLAARGWDVEVVTPVVGITEWPDPASPPVRAEGEGFARREVPTTAAQGIAWALEAAWSVPDPAALRWFASFLGGRRPDVVHVLSNVDVPLDWPEMARRTGAAMVRSVTGPEDLCGLGHPTSPRAEAQGFCQAPLTPARCALCVASTFQAPRRQAEWEQKLRWKRTRAARHYAGVYDRIVFSTATFRQYFEQTLPLPPERVSVVEMGLPPAPPVARRPGDRMRLVALGQLHPTKGTPALVDAFSHPALLKRAGAYRLTFHGGGDSDLVATLLGINPSVSAPGPYRPEDVPSLLADADIGLSASRFETAHRVTREYLRAGVPVIGSHAFGIPDVVRHGHNGLLFDHALPGSLVGALVEILDQPAWVGDLASGARATRIRSVDEEVDEIVEVYAQARAGAP